MPLHSVGRRLRTVGGAPIRVGSNPVLNEKSLTNLCPPFSQWTLSYGATVDANGILSLPIQGAQAQSPLIFINRAEAMSLSASLYTDSPSPYAAFNGQGGRLFGTNYFGADGVTSAATTIGNYTSNGNARSIPLSQWTNRTVDGWNINMGVNIVYAKWVITSDATYASKPLQLKEPMALALASTFTPYGLYYRKGLS